MNRAKARNLTAKIRHRLHDRYLRPISAQQRDFQQDPGQAGLTLWTTQVDFPSPSSNFNPAKAGISGKGNGSKGEKRVDVHSDNIETELVRTIQDLGEGGEIFPAPEAVSMEAEWIGHRRDGRAWQDVVKLKDEEKFAGMEKDRREDVTMLYVHGGAFYLGHPSTSRPTIAKLVQLTGGRALALRYRLAPQNPFPAGLLDVLVAYLSLLYPPPSSLHRPVPPSSIVLTGESAGANLCFALVQFILALGRRQSASVPTLPFHGGHRVPVPLPAGLASACAWLDLTRSLPSWTVPESFSSGSDSALDIYGPGPGPYLSPSFPRDAIWPTTPPRGEMYCDVSALCHPLVSPCAATDWRGAPRMWMCVGEEERAKDAVMVVAKRAMGQGVSDVQILAFEAMPHLFFQLMGRSAQAELCMKEWARFCSECVVGAAVMGREKRKDGETDRERQQPETGLASSYQVVEVESVSKRDVKLEDVAVIEYEDAIALMRAMRNRGGTSTIKAKY